MEVSYVVFDAEAALVGRARETDSRINPKVLPSASKTAYEKSHYVSHFWRFPTDSKFLSEVKFSANSVVKLVAASLGYLL